MTSKEFRRWLASQGAIFKPGKGCHVKVYLNGKQSVLPMHNAELKKGLVEAVKKQPASRVSNVPLSRHIKTR
jgi:mRNA interferase HicA